MPDSKTRDVTEMHTDILSELAQLRVMVQSQLEGLRMEAVQATELRRVIAELQGEAADLRRDLSTSRAKEAQLADLIASKDAEIGELRSGVHELQQGQERLQTENARLQHDLDSSLALRLARSLHWLLEPIRRRIVS